MVALTFNETAMFTQTHAKAMVIRASRGPRVLAKERAKKVRETENPKANPKVPRCQKVRTRVKPQKIGLSGLENPKSETSSETQESVQTSHTDISHTDNSWFDDGWSYGELNDDWSSVGWHECWEQTFDNSACSLSLESFDLGVMTA